MNESQALELQIKSIGEEALKTIDKLVSLLTGVEKTVANIDKTLTKGTVKTTVTDINNLKSTSDKATTSVNKLSKALSLGGAYLGAKRLTTQMLSWMNEAVDFTEQLNLFNVVFKNVEKNGVTAFSNIGKEATQFQYKLNEAFGTNKTQTFYMQGIFQSMGENVGIEDSYSAVMSETMTKLTYDLASLYNKSEKTTAEAIRAGVYAGQTKPLRSFGVDVTQMSLQPIADSLGLETQVKNMSQAEKEILRYLATLKQAQVAMGDFANTVESPSNQLKIFKQQLVETKVAISSLFIGAFASILPYANAFLMVIKEISKAIAMMFGIELKDYNTGIASQEGIYDGIADSVENATGKVKELKRQSLGFDEIHNINENKDTGGGSSGTGGAVGGIDQRLLDAIKGYDNGMDKVRMKATEIRDRIMEWLGFTKKINPLTGETYFEYQGIEKTISNIVSWWEGLNTQGKIWTTLGIALGFVKLFGVMQKIANLTGLTGLFKTLISAGKGFKNLGIVKGLTNLIEYTKIYTSLANGNLLKGIKGGTSAWLKQNGVLTKSNLIIGMIVVGWTSFIKQYNSNIKFKNSVNEIFKSFENLKVIINPLLNLFQSLFGYLQKVGNSLMTIIDSVVNDFVSTISLPFSMFNKLITGDFKGMLDTATGYVGNFFNNLKNTGIAVLNVLPFVHIETEAEKFAKTMKKIEKELFGNGGISIKEYKKSLDNLLSALVEGVPNVDKYNSIIKDSKASYEGAKDSLEILLTQMQTDAYEVTSEEISKVNDVLGVMIDSIDTSGQASTDATTVIVNNLVKQGKMTKEQASNAINSAIQLAKIQKNGAEEFRLKMIDLENQFKNNQISESEYKVKVAELNAEFLNTTNTLDKTKNSVQNFVNYINREDLISTKSWNELNTSIKGIGESYISNKKDLENSYESQKLIFEKQQLDWLQLIETQNQKLENLKQNGKEETQEYRNAEVVLEDYKAKHEEVANNIVTLNKQQKDDAKDLKKVTVEALLGIVATLKQSGHNMKDTSDETVKEINKILKKLGIKDEVDLSQNMDDIINDINKKLNTNIPKTVTKTNKDLSEIGKGVSPVINVKADTSNAKWAVDDFINTAKKSLNFAFGGGTFGGGSGGGRFNANGGIYSNGTWKNIPQYANGGIPSHGSMFIAGERGAEIVGHINGKTEVLNQSQIASAIYSATLNAMSQVMSQYGNQSSEIDVHVHTDEGTVVDRVEQRIKQTGTFPWTIPTY